MVEMTQQMKCRIDQAKKVKHRKRVQANTKLTCRPKKHHTNPQPTAINRPIMFSKLFKEVKEDFAKSGQLVKPNEIASAKLLPRRERRRRMINLARRTMKMIREKGQHRAT